MYKSPAPIRALIPQPQEVPPGLEAIVLKALSKKVDLRYQTMDEIAADLERAERGLVPTAVQEMMGRSGGFNVPADYFRKAQGPAGAGMLPASPPFRKQKPVLAMVLASLGAVSLVVVVLAYALSSKASLTRHDDVPTSASSTAVAPPDSALGARGATTPPPAADKIKVQINVEPKDASVTTPDGRSVVNGATVLVAVNEDLKLKIEKPGFASQTLTLKGAELDREGEKRVVTLSKAGAGGAAAKPPSAFGKPPPKGSAATTAPAGLPPASSVKPPPPPAEKKCDVTERDPFTGKCP
jgi:serine/threonine-protein kinase